MCGLQSKGCESKWVGFRRGRSAAGRFIKRQPFIGKASSARLARADLLQVNLNGARLHSVDFTGANLREADLRGRNLRRANLTDANLRAAKLVGSVLKDAIFCNTTMPDGSTNNSGRTR